MFDDDTKTFKLTLPYSGAFPNEAAAVDSGTDLVAEADAAKAARSCVCVP